MVLPPPPQKTKNKTQKLITIQTLPLQINNKKQNQKKKTQTDDLTGLQFKIVFADRLQNLPGSICSVAETVFPYKALQRDFN